MKSPHAKKYHLDPDAVKAACARLGITVKPPMTRAERFRAEHYKPNGIQPPKMRRTVAS